MAERLTGAAITKYLGITPLINAGGPNTRHSGSRPRPEAIRAMEAMSEVFVQIDELLIAAGECIAELTGNEAATITSGASGGLVVQAAAAMAKDDPDRISQLPITDGMPHELIIQRGHRFIYDHLYLAAGASFVEVGSTDGCTLDEVEAETARTARKLYEGAGITADDLSFENMYDGYAEFHQFHIEGLGYRGMKAGDALDFYQTDISIEGPNPVLPSGGNIGSGRTRFWMHTDSIQQLQGRAGERSVTGVKPEIAVSGGPTPFGGNFTVWSATPD